MTAQPYVAYRPHTLPQSSSGVSAHTFLPLQLRLKKMILQVFVGFFEWLTIISWVVIVAMMGAFLQATMVKEVRTSTGGPGHQKAPNSEPVREHTGTDPSRCGVVYRLDRTRPPAACVGATCVLFVSTPDVMMEDESHDLLCCNERLPSSPDAHGSDSYAEYGR